MKKFRVGKLDQLNVFTLQKRFLFFFWVIYKTDGSNVYLRNKDQIYSSMLNGSYCFYSDRFLSFIDLSYEYYDSAEDYILKNPEYFI